MKRILGKLTILAPILVLALLLYPPEPSVAQVPDDEVDVAYVGASATIPSVSTTQGDAVMVMSITLADEGEDLADVLIEGMTFRKSAGDDFADWTAVIEGAELVDSDGRSDYSSVNILADMIEISGFDQGAGRSGRIANGLSKTYPRSGVST